MGVIFRITSTSVGGQQAESLRQSVDCGVMATRDTQSQQTTYDDNMHTPHPTLLLGACGAIMINAKKGRATDDVRIMRDVLHAKPSQKISDRSRM